MPFDPDIVVTEEGSSHALLIVEAKLGNLGLGADAPLKHYMWEMGCPVGLLISPQEISIYRNLFTSYSDESVERVRAFPAPTSWGAFRGPDVDFEFERSIHRWLEGLRNEKPRDLSPDAADALEQWVIPGLLHGDIHAAGPRVSR
jgi:hypothetical protein